jgi:hypothetical protein
MECFRGYGQTVRKSCLVLAVLVVLASGCSTPQNAEVSTSPTLGSTNSPVIDLPALFGDPVGFSLENYDLQGGHSASGVGSDQEPTKQQIHDEIQRIIMNGGIVGGPNGQLTPSGSTPPQYAPLPTQPGPNQTINTSPVPPQNIGQQQNSPNTTESTLSSVDCSLEVIQGEGVNGVGGNTVGYTYILSAIGPTQSTVFIKVKWSNRVEYSTLTFNEDGRAGAIFSTANARPPIVVAYSDPALSAASLSCSSI